MESMERIGLETRQEKLLYVYSLLEELRMLYSDDISLFHEIQCVMDRVDDEVERINRTLNNWGDEL